MLVHSYTSEIFNGDVFVTYFFCLANLATRYPQPKYSPGREEKRGQSPFEGSVLG